MKRTIKSPTFESGARIHSRVRESIRYDYTLLSLICNIKPTFFYIDGIHSELIALARFGGALWITNQILKTI